MSTDYVSSNPADYAPALVALEGDPTRGTFDALVMRSQRWNGWACPVFPIASVVLLREQLGMDGSSDDAALSDETFTVDSTGPVPVVTMDGDGYDAPEVLAPVILDGTPYWPIGTGGWVWLEVEPPCEQCAWSDAHRMHYCEADTECGHYCAGLDCPWAPES